MQLTTTLILDYFCALAAESSWNKLALVDTIYNGLSNVAKYQLIAVDLPTELDSCKRLS